MTGRPINLTTVEGGMNLLREKGSAPRKNLRLLRNGFVGLDGGARSRFGTSGAALGGDDSHHGLVAHRNQLFTFSHHAGTGTEWTVSAPLPGKPPFPAVDTIVLVNPNDATQPIAEVHLAGQYMGELYVIVEYANGDVFHFWLESVEAWEPNKVYLLGQLVVPSGDQTGYAYRVTRQSPAYPPWAAGDARAIGDRVEPTTVTGWYYEVSNTIGSTPRSGQVEPTWPQQDGAVVWEDVDGVGSEPPTSAEQVPDTALPPDLADRYSNPSGGDGVRRQAE